VIWQTLSVLAANGGLAPMRGELAGLSASPEGTPGADLVAQRIAELGAGLGLDGALIDRWRELGADA